MHFYVWIFIVWIISTIKAEKEHDISMNSFDRWLRKITLKIKNHNSYSDLSTLLTRFCS